MVGLMRQRHLPTLPDFDFIRPSVGGWNDSPPIGTCFGDEEEGQLANQSLKDALLAKLTELGGSAGSGRLREALQWSEASYAAVKDELVMQSLVIPGRGRGGSVALAGRQERRRW